MPPSCAIFDFDGTIADTLERIFSICNELSSQYGYRSISRDQIDEVRNMSASQLFEFVGVARFKVPIILSKGKKLLYQDVQSIQPIPGMTEVIRETRNRVSTLGILTSNSKENVHAFLKANDLEVFDFISTVSKLSGKAKNLKAILRTFALKPNDVVYVGDELRDIKAARKAHVAAAAVTWGFNSLSSLKAKDPDYLFETPRELLDMFNSDDATPEDHMSS